MLEKVVCDVNSPREQATPQWGSAQLWSVSRATAWLERVAAQTKQAEALRHSRKHKAHPYVKFEPLARQERPVFRKLNVWPALDLDALNGARSTPFNQTPTDESAAGKMTRKSRPRITVRGQIKDAAAAADEKLLPFSGYCEICQEEYDSLGDHVRSETHLHFVRNDSNFLTLDTLIQSAGADVQAFLKLNGGAREWRRNGRGTELPEADGYERPRTRKRPPKPGAEAHNLRSRTSQTWSRNSVWSRADDELALGKCVAIEARPRRSCIKAKRVSADERLVVDNKTYYKVEVMTSKLRSSGLGGAGKEQETPRRPSPESEDEGGLVVKFRRVRRSELSVLNDEAENFMFPRKDDSDSDDSELGTDDAPAADTTRSTTKGNSESSDLRSSEPAAVDPEPAETLDESSTEAGPGSSCDSETGSHRKRRRTQAEAFIADNQKYYKFETPGSRLRYQGSIFPVAVPEPQSTKERPTLAVPELLYSFEYLPKSEPWYGTFTRQDRGEEFYTSFSDSGSWMRMPLPYQLPPLPPLNPQVCWEEYERARELCLNPSTAGTSASGTPTPGDVTPTAEPPDTPQPDDTDGGRRRKKRPRFANLQRNPRKSPRQHASTLAILSSLIQQRKRREKRALENEAARRSLSCIPEEEDGAAEPDEDYATVSRAVDEILDVPIDPADFAGMSEVDGIALQGMNDAIALIESYNGEASPRRRVVDRTKRKRKKNRTGWPKKKRLFVRRDVKSEAGSSAGVDELDFEVKCDELDDNEGVDIENCVSNDSNEENKYESAKTSETEKLSSDKLALEAANVLVVLNSLDTHNTPCRKESRNVSTDCVEEVTVGSTDRLSECVNVDLDKWENAEKFLHAKMAEPQAAADKLLQYQPFVKVQKMDGLGILANRRLRSSSTRVKRQRVTSPGGSPRKLRAPRGKWYRER